MKKVVSENSNEKFSGFYPETYKFFANLTKNNNKVWFDKHREDYESFVLDPVKKFILSIKGFLNYINPELIVEPKFNKSLVRINNDMRFAKIPYKEYFLVNFGRFKWDSALYLFLRGEYICLGCFINQEKKAESLFNINVNQDRDKFISICEEYKISKKYTIADIRDIQTYSTKFNPVKDLDKMLITDWVTIDKAYEPKNKRVYSSKFLEDAFMVFNNLYPLVIYATSNNLNKDLADYKNKIGRISK
jgi:uncharacterized protein (DUF2461 family)